MGRCAAFVCTLCMTELALDEVKAGSHQCGRRMKEGGQMDAVSLEALEKKVRNGKAKRCPCCSNFIEKAEGCDFMMCGTNCHGNILDAMRNGGCGYQFKWSDGSPANTFYNDLSGKKVSRRVKASEQRDALEKIGRKVRIVN